VSAIVVFLLAGKNIFSQTAKVSGPETRITAIPPIPGAVDIAQMVVFIFLLL
jgi:hypothetical protein